MSEEYQGVFLRETNATPATRRPVAEGVDEELIKVGVRYTDLTQPKERTEVPEANHEPAEEEYLDAKVKVGKAAKVLASLGSLVAVDTLAIFMCMADKIDLAYGLVFLAAASAFLGAKVNNARV